MKYFKTSIVGVFVAIMLSGCIVSLHPLYTEKDVIFEPDLVGQWAEGEEKWEFEKVEGSKAYSLAYTDKHGEKGRFFATLLKVRGHIFLDLEPAAPDIELQAFYMGHLQPVHTFYHVKQITPVLQIRALISNLGQDGTSVDLKEIRHEKQDKTILLTAQSKELQEFLIKHLNNAFGNVTSMKRISSEDDTETEEKALSTEADPSGDRQAASTVPE